MSVSIIQQQFDKAGYSTFSWGPKGFLGVKVKDPVVASLDIISLVNRMGGTPEDIQEAVMMLKKYRIKGNTMTFPVKYVKPFVG